jgi:hypothetical protein
MVSDWITNNDVDGLMWESERQGPLNNTLGAHFGAISSRRSNINCFCEHCFHKAKDAGIDGQRARQGYIALDHWVSRTLSQSRVADGTFVSLWRVFLEYPEILAWERFYPGIDIDIPTGLNEKRTQPSDVKAATLAALKAGAPGVVLSRKYAEMKLTNVAGAGEALREFGATGTAPSERNLSLRG